MTRGLRMVPVDEAQGWHQRRRSRRASSSRTHMASGSTGQLPNRSMSSPRGKHSEKPRTAWKLRRLEGRGPLPLRGSAEVTHLCLRSPLNLAKRLFARLVVGCSSRPAPFSTRRSIIDRRGATASFPIITLDVYASGGRSPGSLSLFPLIC